MTKVQKRQSNKNRHSQRKELDQLKEELHSLIEQRDNLAHELKQSNVRLNKCAKIASSAISKINGLTLESDRLQAEVTCRRETERRLREAIRMFEVILNQKDKNISFHSNNEYRLKIEVEKLRKSKKKYYKAFRHQKNSSVYNRMCYDQQLDYNDWLDNQNSSLVEVIKTHRQNNTELSNELESIKSKWWYKLFSKSK